MVLLCYRCNACSLLPLKFSAPSSGHSIWVTKLIKIKTPERGEKIEAEALKYFPMQLIGEMTLQVTSQQSAFSRSWTPMPSQLFRQPLWQPPAALPGFCFIFGVSLSPFFPRLLSFMQALKCLPHVSGLHLPLLFQALHMPKG